MTPRLQKQAIFLFSALEASRSWRSLSARSNVLERTEHQALPLRRLLCALLRGGRSCWPGLFFAARRRQAPVGIEVLPIPAVRGFTDSANRKLCTSTIKSFNLVRLTTRTVSTGCGAYLHMPGTRRRCSACRAQHRNSSTYRYGKANRDDSPLMKPDR